MKNVIMTCVLISVVIAFVTVAALNYSVATRENRSQRLTSIESVEALASVEINGQRYMTAQEISDAMNSFSGWLMQSYWTPCFVSLAVKVTKTSGGIQAGTIYYGIEAVASLSASGISYSVIENQPGQRKYCPDGWSTCSPKACS